MTYDGPQTDWGKLDATHPPQRNKVNHFAGALTPDDYTLDTVESPRNSNWFLVLMAARRAITFLEQQPEVDPARIGVYGHSMGGKLTTDLAGIDKRVKAAVPSCGARETFCRARPTCPEASRPIPRPWNWPASPTMPTSRGSPARCFGCRQPTTSTPTSTTWLGTGATCPTTACVSAFLRTSIIAIRTSTPSPSIFGSRSI